MNRKPYGILPRESIESITNNNITLDVDDTVVINTELSASSLYTKDIQFGVANAITNTSNKITQKMKTNQTIAGLHYTISPSAEGINLTFGDQETGTDGVYYKTGNIFTRDQFSFLCTQDATSHNIIQLNNTADAATSVNNHVSPGGHRFFENDAGKYGFADFNKLILHSTISNYSGSIAEITTAPDGTFGGGGVFKVSTRSDITNVGGGGVMTERMSVDSAGDVRISGKVRIGSQTAPDQALSVTGNIAATGNVGCAAIAASGNVGCAAIAATGNLNCAAITASGAIAASSVYTSSAITASGRITTSSDIVATGGGTINGMLTFNPTQGTTSTSYINYTGYAGHSRAYIRGLHVFLCDTGGTVHLPGQSFNSSDDRLKHNETSIINGLSVISKLTPKKYDRTESMKDANFVGKLSEYSYEEAGFIAQEVLNIPELSFTVHVPQEDVETTAYGLNYNSIFTYSVAAIKELDAIVTAQSELISKLEARLTAIGG